jgi:hypothetical protein
MTIKEDATFVPELLLGFIPDEYSFISSSVVVVP